MQRIATISILFGLLGAAPLLAQTPLVEVKDRSGETQLRIDDNGSLLATGELNFGSPQIPASGPGVRMMWYPEKAAFRVGSVTVDQWDDAKIGPYSMGIGTSTQAIGQYAFAGGAFTRAEGTSSVAIGRNVSATGDYATAMGRFVSAAGDGSFIFGDASTNATWSAGENEFVVRAVGGFRFYTADLFGAGVQLGPGEGSWSSASDRNKKENIHAVDAQEVLKKLLSMDIASWNYKTQPDSIRHIGPMAQDFYAAFGLGASDTTITTIDADGVALLAIQALAAEVAALRAELRALNVETLTR